MICKIDDGSTPLSFLFLGYRKRCYYEFIMAKKGGLILLSVFLKNFPRYQIIGANLLIQISFFMHVFLNHMILLLAMVLFVIN